MTAVAGKGGSKIRIGVVVTRADGTKEDWGRMVHASERDRCVYALTHPLVMLNRLRWRLKQWFRS
jgi:hypothetical protein